MSKINFNSNVKIVADVSSRIYETIQSSRQDANRALQAYEPLHLVTVTLMLAILLRFTLRALMSVVIEIQDHGLIGALGRFFFCVVRFIPGVQTYIKKEEAKVVDKLRASMVDKRKNWLTKLPKAGAGYTVLEQLEKIRIEDKAWQGKCSGTVYWGGESFEQHVKMVNEAYSMFSHTNPLHADIFPSVAKFEAEVVAMTAALLGSLSPEAGGQVCGNMTSGGSESILMAVKATRDYMRATKNISHPEMVVAHSAHSAYDKAALYFGIRLRRAPVNPKSFRADVAAMRRLVTGNTIMIVASAPGFPHGVIDPVQELGQLALSRGVCLHVDLCLGGFVLPFAKKLGYNIPAFDFQVPGVTSVSVDVHKYGLGPKGTSVILYRNHEIRRHQFVAVTDWSGGLYISPTSAGSRAGGLIAGAWAAMVALGEQGYLDATKQIMEASQQLIAGINIIDDLYVLGKPDMSIVAFGSSILDVYQVNDVMTSKGWVLNALQRPSSVHMCVTLQHVNVVEDFLRDLRAAVLQVKENPNHLKDGMAPIYGAASTIPDRGTVRDLLVAYMDSTC